MARKYMSIKNIKLHFTIKYVLDTILSFIAIILLIPLWLGIAIAIKTDSKGPVFFIQERLTKNGKVFKMYKFRSMIAGAEYMGTGLFTYDHDPRVTKVGRFLRCTSLDELPQLFNVLKGDISIVGPRPAVTYELGDYSTLNKKYKKRFRVKGGITGLAQIKGRNENSWEEKVILDNCYIDEFKKYGILLDAWIIIKTVIKVFNKSNIYEKKLDNNISDNESAALSEAEIIRIAHLPD